MPALIGSKGEGLHHGGSEGGGESMLAVRGGEK